VILLDVGVWLAAVWGRHVHHPIVAAWVDQQSLGLVLCRVTQMSLLRLLSNPAVMGADVVDRSGAWHVIDELRADSRVTWADEPRHVEAIWRALSARENDGHKLWTTTTWQPSRRRQTSRWPPSTAPTPSAIRPCEARSCDSVIFDATSHRA
jgi:predicted nucleic acid-binding protein